MSVEKPFPREDLEHVEREAATVWRELKGTSLFITGATGFFGRWLLESLFLADQRRGLGVRVVALSRDPESFLRKAPHMSVPGLSWRKGSVATLSIEEFNGDEFDTVLHLATEADMQAHQKDPVAGNGVITEGTRRVLEVAARTGARRFLFTSSGAAQGPQPPDMDCLPADGRGEWPNDRPAAYALSGEAKRLAEDLCFEELRRTGLGAVVARGFTFAGPGLPLDSKFAFGNFMRDALEGGPIVIKGDGTPLRSYLYAADLAAWLWTLLFQGRPGQIYNVGSEHTVSILQLAEAISRELDVRNIQVLQKPRLTAPFDRYVPSTQRAREEFGLRESFSLSEIIRRTAAWHGAVLKH
jgi:nucleoside-diphosphate-sugar epimerase